MGGHYCVFVCVGFFLTLIFVCVPFPVQSLIYMPISLLLYAKFSHHYLPPCGITYVVRK